MSVYPDHKFHWIRDTVNTYFDFLLRQGFRIISVVFTTQGMEDWQVVMLSDDRFIRVCCDHGKIALELSSMQLLNHQVGFFDLGTMLELSMRWDETYTIFDAEGKNEKRQIEELACLFKKHFAKIIQQFDALSSFILDRLWLISEPNQNGRLSKNNLPF